MHYNTCCVHANKPPGKDLLATQLNHNKATIKLNATGEAKKWFIIQLN